MLDAINRALEFLVSGPAGVFTSISRAQVFAPQKHSVIYFDVPMQDSDRYRFVKSERAGSALQCWLDGKFVGYSQDSFLPAEFEITAHLESKWPSSSCLAGGGGGGQEQVLVPDVECILSVKCFRFCDGSYMEAQDMWWLSGIHREIVLYSKPACGGIWDYRYSTSLSFSDDAPHTPPAASICVEVEVRQGALARHMRARK